MKKEKIQKKINLDKINIKNLSLDKLFSIFNNERNIHFLKRQSKFKSQNYSLRYEEKFKHLKKKKLDILELFPNEEALTASFNKYFKKSFITAVYKNNYNFNYHSKRIQVLQANYLNKKLIKKNFDIIIDSGDHSKSQILKNLRNFISLVNPEGTYVIQDLDLHESFKNNNDLKKETTLFKILKNFEEKKIFKSELFSLQQQIDIIKIIDKIKIFRSKTKKNNSTFSNIVFIKVKKKENIIKSKNLILKPMEIRNLNKNFIDKMNLKTTNKFTQIKNKKQTFKTSFQYFLHRIKNNELYYSMNTLRGQFFGTLTMREISNQQAYFGILVFEKKFQGTYEIKVATNIFLDFCFKKFKLRSNKGRTYIKNKSANFNLIINNFNIIEEMGPLWELQVTKKKFNKNYKYDVI